MNQEPHKKRKKKLLETLISKCPKRGQKSVIHQEDQTEKNEKVNKQFLKFVAFALSENFSFSQVQRLGEFLARMYNANELNFLKSHKFYRQDISQIAVECLGVSVLESLKEDLEKNKFSFVLDNSTYFKENLCAIRVRYVKESFNHEENKSNLTIEDRLIGLEKLGADSTSKTLLNTVKDKISMDNYRIKENLIGVTTDNANSLQGNHNGMVTLLQTEQSSIFNLRDPCHCLSLVLKKSPLPQDILQFIQKIFHHFTSPKKRFSLASIQSHTGHRVLMPKEYCSAKWLTLGQALERIIDIWPSLTIYMEEMEKKESIKPEKNNSLDYSSHKKLFNDQLFKSKVIVFSHIVSILNSSNEKLQTKNLEIQHLKGQITLCIEALARLIVRPEKLYSGLEVLSKVEWKKPEVQKEWFVDNPVFLSYLSEKFGLELLLPANKSLSESKRKEFCSFFKSYLVDVLVLCSEKLPLQDKIIDLLDFVELKDEFYIIEQKIKTFAKNFNLVPANKYIELENELHDLHKRGFYGQKIQAQTKNKDGKLEISTLKLWNLIQESHHYTYLPIIFKFAQSLPCSSANVEQTFSRIKHIKSYARNKLSIDSLESLLFIAEEFRKKEDIVITDKMMESYKKLREEIKGRKGGTEVNTSQPSGDLRTQEEEKNSRMIIEERKEDSQYKLKFEQICSNEEDLSWSEDEDPSQSNSWGDEGKIIKKF